MIIVMIIWVIVVNIIIISFYFLYSWNRVDDSRDDNNQNNNNDDNRIDGNYQLGKQHLLCMSCNVRKVEYLVTVEYAVVMGASYHLKPSTNFVFFIGKVVPIRL